MRLVTNGTVSVSGATITAWAAYSATLTNMGTSPSQTLFWRRVGENVEIRGFITIGSSPPGSEGRIGLPNGYSADSTYSGTQPCGTWWFGNTHAQHGGSLLAQASTAYLVFSNAGVFGDSSCNAGTQVNTSTNFGAGEFMYLSNVSIRITGLTP